MTVLLGLAVIALVTVVAWTAPLLARPTLPFGVRVPAAHTGAPELRACQRRHGERVLAVGALAAVTLLGVWLWSGWAPGPRWVAPLVVLDVLMALLASAEVAKVKRRNDFAAGTRSVVVADTGLRTSPERVPWLLFLPAAALAGIAVALGASWSWAPALNPVLVLLTVLLAVLAILRARPEIEPDRPAASAHRYRLYLRGLSRLLALSAGAANLTLLMLALREWQVLPDEWWLTPVAFLPVLLALGFWVRFAVRVGDAGHRLPGAPEVERPDARRDDDRYWYAAGMLYA
ncbi:hypothetical protein, partial [Crossiella equi]